MKWMVLELQKKVEQENLHQKLKNLLRLTKLNNAQSTIF